MFGPTYEAACPGYAGFADHSDAALVHLNNRDVTLSSISRPPIDKLQAYKRRMGMATLGLAAASWVVAVQQMVMPIALGVMSVTWMCVIAALVFGQKLLPPRASLDVPVAAIVALGMLIVVAPASVRGLVL